MKKLLLSAILGASSLFSFGQYQEISIHDLQFVSQQDLANCNDTSAYFGDTVIIVGMAIHDGGLTEQPSSSTPGGYRPAIWVVDTANNNAMDAWSGVQIHGVFGSFPNTSPVNELDNIQAGWIIKVAGSIGRFNGETQFNPINNDQGTIAGGAAIEIINTGTVAPEPVLLNIGDLNDANRENQLETGEQWEGVYAEFVNLTVTAVNPFNGGSRVSFDVADANGNIMNVSDRFIAQKLPSHVSVNAASPQTTGEFVAPVVGAQFDTLRGIIIHGENGCTGGTGRGYELNPFDSNDYVYGATPPNITNEVRTPFVPTPSESVEIKANITDFDGNVTGSELSYSVDNGNNFTTVTMSLVGGTTDEYTATVPAQTEGSVVLYFIEAEDNDNNTARFPGSLNTYRQYVVRENGLTIVDIQKTNDPNADDNSPFLGEEVTVTGVVTASTKANDLGFVYIQQEGANEYAGISLQGSSELISLFRNDEVTVTGTVRENFGFTYIEVSSLNQTGACKTITPVYMDPSDAALHTDRNLEKYESMLVGLANPSGNPMEVATSDFRFGEYGIGTDENASVETRVIAGRQGTNSSSSLAYSLITDDQASNNPSDWTQDDGVMTVAPVYTVSGMQIDTLYGIMYYSFSNYKLIPRNNTDLKGLADASGSSIAIEETEVQVCDEGNIGIAVVDGESILVTMFPNPAQNEVRIAFEKEVNVAVEIYDLSGRNVMNSIVNGSQATITTSTLQQGAYLVRIAELNGKTITTERLLIQR